MVYDLGKEFKGRPLEHCCSDTSGIVFQYEELYLSSMQ